MIAEREGIHKKIQSVIQHEDKEAEVAAEDMLEVSPAWNEVTDHMNEAKDSKLITEAATKQKRDEVAPGRRKLQREDGICPEKREHSPTVSWRTRNPAGFSIQKIGMNFNKKQMNGRCQINGS